MATKSVYVIRDRIAGCVASPLFIEWRDGSAVRQFLDILSRGQGPITEHPADYDLLCLGLVEDSTGEIEACTPRVIANGEDLVRRQDADVATN